MHRIGILRLHREMSKKLGLREARCLWGLFRRHLGSKRDTSAVVYIENPNPARNNNLCMFLFLLLIHTNGINRHRRENGNAEGLRCVSIKKLPGFLQFVSWDAWAFEIDSIHCPIFSWYILNMDGQHSINMLCMCILTAHLSEESFTKKCIKQLSQKHFFLYHS